MFGQSDDGGADSDVGGSTRRPAPDMRRYMQRGIMSHFERDPVSVQHETHETLKNSGPVKNNITIVEM